MGVDEISLGDTIGVGTPKQTKALINPLKLALPLTSIAMHFHDTFGRAVENARAAAGFGITVFDASAGGIGGCPYAPGATGNVATQDLVRLFPEQTGADFPRLEAASALVRGWLTP